MDVKKEAAYCNYQLCVESVVVGEQEVVRKATIQGKENCHCWDIESLSTVLHGIAISREDEQRMKLVQ